MKDSMSQEGDGAGWQPVQQAGWHLSLVDSMS